MLRLQRIVPGIVLQLKRRFAQRPIYHGWVLAWMLGPAQLVTWGIVYYTFSVMLTPMQRELGWSTAEITGAFSLALLAGGLAAVPVGRWLDQHGPRVLMTLGVVAASLLVLAWSQVQTLIVFYAVWFVLGLLMAAVLYEPAFWIIARWFSNERTRQRGRALTVLTFFGGLASTVFIPLSNTLQQACGWREALVILAVVLGTCTILPYALLLRPSRHPSSQHEMGVAPRMHAPRARGIKQLVQIEAMREPAFWLLTIAFGLTNMASSALSVHLIAYGIARGQEAAFVAAAAGLVGVMQVVGRVTFVPLADRVSHKHIAAFLCALQSGALAALLLLPPVIGLLTYAALFGIGHGAMTPMRVTLVADAFGVQSYGSISGMMSLIVTFARAIAPVAVGLAVVASSSYTPAMLVLLVASLVAAAVVLRLNE